MNNAEEILHCLALSHIPGIGLMGARNLFNVFGNATEVFSRKSELMQQAPAVAKRLLKLLDFPQAMELAKRELEFSEKNHIDCIAFNDKRYPSRLRECEDAPLMLFFKGKADLNALKVISIVGTRNATDYGRQCCESFLADLSQRIPDVLVVSGLAYGVDICAHRAALERNLPTIGEIGRAHV